MKYILGFLTFSIYIALPLAAFSEGYAGIDATLWTNDETKFVLKYGNGFDTEEYDHLEIFKVGEGPGKSLKVMEKSYDNNKPSTAAKRELQKLKRTLQLRDTHWVARDPLSFKTETFPCCWPPKVGGHYEQTFQVNRRKATFILDTSGEKGSNVETTYRLSIKKEGEKASRLLYEWHRPENYDDNKGQYFALGAVGLSPSANWICLLLRRFDYGFESSDAVPMPFFFPTKNLMKN